MEVEVGADPSRVYRILAPGVVVVIITLTEVVNVPPFGVKIGATTGLIVKIWLVTALELNPLWKEAAFMVVVVKRWIGVPV